MPSQTMPDAASIRKNPDIDKILVVGPNGNIASRLIPELLELGYKVRALQYRTKVQKRPGMDVVEGNTLDFDSIQKGMQGVQAVCHLIRATGPGRNPFEKWFNCAVAGAANLLEAARQTGLTRYIAGSADNVFGHVTIPHHSSIDENSPKRFADGYYGLFKIVEEEMCRQYHLGFDVPVVIVRFGLTWTDDLLHNVAGALDRENRKIRKQLDRHGKSLVRHDGHVNDAVQGILLSLENDAAIGQDFNFVANAPYSSTELCQVIARKYNWPIEEQKTDWYSWTTSNEKARSVLGYKPQINILDWIGDTL